MAKTKPLELHQLKPEIKLYDQLYDAAARLRALSTALHLVLNEQYHDNTGHGFAKLLEDQSESLLNLAATLQVE